VLQVTLYTSLQLRGWTAEFPRSDSNRQVIRFTRHALLLNSLEKWQPLWTSDRTQYYSPTIAYSDKSYLARIKTINIIIIIPHNSELKQMPWNNPLRTLRNSTCSSVFLFCSNILTKSSFPIRLSRPLRRSCADLLSRIHSGVKKLRRSSPERLPPWSSRVTTEWRLSMAFHALLGTAPLGWFWNNTKRQL